ncbi:GMC family oxidoreductase [Niveibacterium umoris]|uniref:Choline dehydrogenase-like flavoprotein n=1 Tax=Niveibacterium umoris TaxID=1193620 RepID=A0A840BPB9_9RHOO|nr:GMC family oxidoreductase [Niveibacterium umoris]MBB4014473.1 choline dehydrogenase-like flavoprotein [Niveibacterium umoris]
MNTPLQTARHNQLPDPIGEAFDGKWRDHHIDGAKLEKDLTLEADVVIVGTGAGGGTTAERLTQAGLSVILLEEGALNTSRDFQLEERLSYPRLYQESAGRKTMDHGVGILQGRTVGGSTVVNWTTSIRTPDNTLAHWREHHGLSGLTPEAMQPWFERREERLSIAAWPTQPNRHNALLRDGAYKLALEPVTIHRNVKGCWNLGYCGMGCSTNAKQSMLVTTIPAAMDHGARLLSRMRAERLEHANGRVSALIAHPMDAFGQVRRDRTVRLQAKHFVLAGGAIGTPALLLRSAAPDPHRHTGARTFLHPVVLSAALMPEPVEAFTGAPQSIYIDEYLWPKDGSMGFKLEVPPIHPLIASVVMSDFGEAHRHYMRQMNHWYVAIALLRDGFHEQSQGGRVVLDGHGDPQLDYPLTDYVWAGARKAFHAMADLQYAVGAKTVLPIHLDAKATTRVADAHAQIDALKLATRRTKVVSAHVMGGAAMSPDEKGGVVRPDGVHHQLENLSVHDGSILPTSLGANPQLTIYGLTAMLSEQLVKRLGKA